MFAYNMRRAQEMPVCARQRRFYYAEWLEKQWEEFMESVAFTDDFTFEYDDRVNLQNDRS